MTTIIGIDYSGAKSDRNTWVAIGRLMSDGALLFDSAQMRRRNEVTELLATTSTPAVAGIDFPFGVPLEFADFLNTSKGIRSLPEAWRIVSDLRLDDFNAARDAFVDRFGEPKRAGDATHFTESFSPLHKANPNMIPMTYYGMQMIHELSATQAGRWLVPPLQASGNALGTGVTLLETMPGAFLKAIGTIYKGYKKPKSLLDRNKRRNRILDDISFKSGIALPNLSELRDDCLANDDCLDAVVAAVAAACWAMNPERFRHPDADELSAARLEGWIYVPKSAE